MGMSAFGVEDVRISKMTDEQKRQATAAGAGTAATAGAAGAGVAGTKAVKAELNARATRIERDAWKGAGRLRNAGRLNMKARHLTRVARGRGKLAAGLGAASLGAGAIGAYANRDKLDDVAKSAFGVEDDRVAKGFLGGATKLFSRGAAKADPLIQSGAAKAGNALRAGTTKFKTLKPLNQKLVAGGAALTAGAGLGLGGKKLLGDGQPG